EQHGSDPDADLPLPADRVEGRLLSHRTLNPSIGVDIVEEHETGAVRLARIDDVPHQTGPLLPPDPRVVLESCDQVRDLAASDSTRGGGRTQKVRRHEFVVSRDALGRTADPANALAGARKGE